MKISLVIPVFNESKTIAELISTIKAQSLQPDRVIFVDGGSVDNTVQLLKELTFNDSHFFIIEVKRALPGEGRNIGAANAKNEWIAFTDAGIKLDNKWLEYLVKRSEEQPGAAIIYGNYAPQVNNFFDKCSTIAYVPPAKESAIRGKSIVSCLLKKEVWENAGGFPPWRATEDLVFMEKAEALDYNIAMSPEAVAWWKLQPAIDSVFKKFDLYSKWNVWAGRQAYWHYGIARQYILMLIPLLLSIFHSWYWLLAIPLWILARVAKRIILHRYEFGLKNLFNPAVVCMVALITLVIDAATFSGWIKAIISKPPFDQKIKHLQKA